jgi:Domain of unknown function (DUF4262)
MECTHPSEEEFNKTILDNIERTGLHITSVMGNGYTPGFSYTVGLYKGLGHPELIAYGLKIETALWVLNDIKDDIAKGKRFEIGVDYHDYLADYPIQFIEVNKFYYREHLGSVAWHNDNNWDFPAWQVVWTDFEGRFPWDNDFNPDYKRAQPLLDRNMDFRFLEERNICVFTTKQVSEGSPILLVEHDSDGAWQFHTGDAIDFKDAKVVSLESLVKMDATLNELYYLGYGKMASRQFVGDEWVIEDAEEGYEND